MYKPTILHVLYLYWINLYILVIPYIYVLVTENRFAKSSRNNCANPSAKFSPAFISIAFSTDPLIVRDISNSCLQLLTYHLIVVIKLQWVHKLVQQMTSNCLLNLLSCFWLYLIQVSRNVFQRVSNRLIIASVPYTCW